ncbi:glycoside hydrolase family 88 protein [Jiangella rhizosphaerae]|uniref:Glucuronyl hydrolase n=1 Tax=Jiangella rhizosphaerae TaxID=2293569 RepID=A0A418KVC8_9ACTN|nr:glycoside hydrolase family 88 protein [Jiangella rhizosphaerae]RIQ33692.1 glucuronyl hydrolase [Jiangella rhizosphaerae]
MTTMRPLTAAVGLYDHYESVAEVKHYYGLLAIYGLARTAAAAGDEDLWARTEKILRRFPDGVDHPHYNFPSYRIGGIPQAYLLAQGRMADRADLVREYAEEMMTAPRDHAGLVVLPAEPAAEKIWIDAAMATAPYLLYAGLALEDERYLDEAVHQAVGLHDALIDHSCGLLHQCRNFVAPDRFSQDHWSRGNGWGYLALAELVDGLPASSQHREDVERRFAALSYALLPHQSHRGLWRQEIPHPLAYEETSGSALILYGIGVGLRTGVLDAGDFGPAFRRGIGALTSICVNPDFSTEFSCPGCLCPGTGPRKGTLQSYMTQLPHRDEPHSFGPLLLALAEAHRHGVTAVELRPGRYG